MTIIIFLFIGWGLSWVNLDLVFIQAFKELFDMEITIASYYFIFFVIGALGDLILFYRNRRR